MAKRLEADNLYPAVNRQERHKGTGRKIPLIGLQEGLSYSVLSQDPSDEEIKDFLNPPVFSGISRSYRRRRRIS